MKKTSEDKVTNIAIIIGLVIVAILAGFIFFPQKLTKTASDPNLKSYTSDGLTIKTTLSKDLVAKAQQFVSLTVKTTVLPKEITLTLAQKGKDDMGDTYIANWNKDGKFLSLLVGLTKNNTAINYQRIWTMPEAQPVTSESANTLLKDIFKDTFVTDVGQVTCKDIAMLEDKTLTECGLMKTISSGDLVGTTVRSPVDLTPPPETTPPPNTVIPTVTIVSACFIPKEGTSVYTSSVCI